ncbi:uncharacterized protein PHACADRAFT_164138 [Phanerochaete carnosa HHB-10118-sp]|uniref:Uncharacterized protein n=1 Tax=Phanerochaete carnosa (strain HHB-10118-sp) TaxID=650164 RepID=K5VLB0_PHACS|nr:uncharacterized protein PHACADRAFT_164138 [Phanerochaete carnosa HHB-10118-sp]EKM52208.1 hypothetical protein PHACADRAFT_164138 [Phanerochaete carnosa HHB-10118-sp]
MQLFHPDGVSRGPEHAQQFLPLRSYQRETTVLAESSCRPPARAPPPSVIAQTRTVEALGPLCGCGVNSPRECPGLASLPMPRFPSVAPPILPLLPALK